MITSDWRVTAQTTDAELERIPYLDMRDHATQLRDWAANTETSDGVLLIAPDHTVATYCTDVDGWAVLFEPAFGVATVNRASVGVGNSVIVEDVWSVAEAVTKARGEENA
jgi:hypothetical protein